MDRSTPVPWPQKTREVVNAIMDSTMWNRFCYRDDDIVVASFAKTGTTWTQAILVQLIHGAPEVVRVGQVCRWIDCAWDKEERMLAVEAQTHRRILKSHLPADAIVFSPRATNDHTWTAWMPSVLPVQPISCGGATERRVDATFVGPVLQRNWVPSVGGPSIWRELTSGFQSGQLSKSAMTFQATSGGTGISTSLEAMTGALVETSMGRC